MILDGSQINLLIAFVGGLITFFASCLLPLVPTYLAYLSGLTLSSSNSSSRHKEIFLNSLLFVVGFVIVFVLLGAVANSFGTLIVAYKPIMQQLGGVLLIVMGLFMLQIIKLSWLYRELKINVTKIHITKWRYVNSLLFGVTFGFAWTPCVGPVLAVILFWASQAQTFWQGTGLLLTYGLGLGLPFLIIGLLFDQLAPKISSASKFGHQLQILVAIIIIITGLFLFFGRAEYLSVKLLQYFNLNTLAV